MVFTVVQPVDHGRVLGHLDEELAIVPHAFVAELDDHVHDIVVMIHLGHPGSEHLMPEQRHLFFQEPPGVEHVVQPFSGTHAR
jgi:hypothetical protein